MSPHAVLITNLYVFNRALAEGLGYIGHFGWNLSTLLNEYWLIMIGSTGISVGISNVIRKWRSSNPVDALYPAGPTKQLAV